jgi:hypothetical protein
MILINLILGPDCAPYRVHDGEVEETVDEIEEYWNACYLSTGEAAWRIFNYTITKKEPLVTPVSTHLSDQSNRQYHQRENDLSAMSTLNHYFCRPSGSFIYQGHNRRFQDLIYVEYFCLFHLQKYNANHTLSANYFLEQANQYGQPPMHVILRNENHPHLARIHNVPPSCGELFYLRTLLQHRAARSHQDARTIDALHHHNQPWIGIEYAL